jgi:hypothetical protein
MYHIRRVAEHAWHDELASMAEDDALMACITGLQSPKRDPIPPASYVAEHHLAWTAANLERVLPVRYEDVLAEPAGSFAQIVAHLGLDPGGRLPAAIARRNRFERLTVGRAIWRPMRPPGRSDDTAHVRRGIAGGWRKHFNQEHVAAFKDVAGRELVLLGYEAGVDW